MNGSFEIVVPGLTLVLINVMKTMVKKQNPRKMS